MRIEVGEVRMKQFENERKSNVAWFKLTELISRGEREKALSFYRLLSHSFEDKAYALQLEGDILWAFEDGTAVDKYRQAAFLYKKEQKIVSAIAVYEHLLTLNPDCVEYVSFLIEGYIRLDWVEKVKEYFNILMLLAEQKDTNQESIFSAIHSIVDFLLSEEGKELKDCSYKNILCLLMERNPMFAKDAEVYAAQLTKQV